MAILPVVALLAILFFSASPNPDQDNVLNHGRSNSSSSSTQSVQEAYAGSSNPKSVDQSNTQLLAPGDPDQDFKTIYTFIRNNYQNVGKDEARSIADYLVEYGRKHDIDPKLVAALMARESSFNRKAVSSTGAKGLGQIKDFNYKSLDISNPFDIRQNASGTSQYLKEMVSNWKDRQDKLSLALASYYKGYGAVKASNGELDSTAQGYVDDILKNYESLIDLQKTGKTKK